MKSKVFCFATWKVSIVDPGHKSAQDSNGRKNKEKPFVFRKFQVSNLVALVDREPQEFFRQINRSYSLGNNCIPAYKIMKPMLFNVNYLAI